MNASHNEHRSGMTLIEIMIVVGVVALLAAIAMPAFAKMRNVSQKNACINTLRLMDSAKEQAALASMWATGRAISNGSAEETAVLQYLKGGLQPSCPAGGTYTWNAIGTSPTCSEAGHALGN